MAPCSDHYLSIKHLTMIHFDCIAFTREKHLLTLIDSSGIPRIHRLVSTLIIFHTVSFSLSISAMSCSKSALHPASGLLTATASESAFSGISEVVSAFDFAIALSGCKRGVKIR